MKRMRLLSSLATRSAVDRGFCVAPGCSSLSTASDHIHQGARPIGLQSEQLPARQHSAQRTRRRQSRLAHLVRQLGTRTMADATNDLAQRDSCNGGASDPSHAPPMLDSDFLLRHDAGSAPQETVVVVLNWNLPACTPRLLSAGGLGSTIALCAATHARA